MLNIKIDICKNFLIILGLAILVNVGSYSIGYAYDEYVGFASMAIPENAAPNSKIFRLSKVLFDMKYASFQRVVAKLNIQGIRPKTLGYTEEDRGNKIPLRPHPMNLSAIKKFHNEVQQTGEDCLTRLGAINSARAIIFDEINASEEALDEIEQLPELGITIYAFYSDSNTLAPEYLDIDPNADYNSLKSKIQEHVVLAMEQVVINQGMMMASEDPTSSSPTQSSSAQGSEW